MYLILRNAAVLDVVAGRILPGCDVVVEGETIREVAERPVPAGGATVIDVGGRTVMPGLIDCHVHVTAIMLDLGANALVPQTLLAYRVLPILRGMLERGFTTVRDCGGADRALAEAVAEGIVYGPRILVSGLALSQTGGHADFRGRWDESPPPEHCCRRLGRLGRIVDGVDACRRAVREEIKAGAHQVKVMASGGIASPTDPIGFTQFSEEELRAICAEAEAAETYVMAHTYTARAIRRAVACGVRSIEHGNLVDRETAVFMAGHGAFAVPTLVTFAALTEQGAALGCPPESRAKIESVCGGGMASLELFRDAGVRIAFGTDLLGELHARQSEEFLIRSRVFPAIEILRQATLVGAELLNLQGRLGVVAAGAVADLLVVDGDPIAEIAVLTRQGRHLDAILKAGTFVKNHLS